MPISSQCLQNKNIGEFYNETHKEYNHLLMRCNSNYKNRVDNYNDNLSNFKESGVAMDFISATNNNCPDFRKKTGVDTTKKTLVTLAIFLLCIKQAGSSDLNSSSPTEALTTTSALLNNTGFNVYHSIGYYNSDNDNSLAIKSSEIEKNRKTNRIKRGGDIERIEAFKAIIDVHRDQLLPLDEHEIIQAMLDILAQHPDILGMANPPNPLRIEDLPEGFRNVILRFARGPEARVPPHDELRKYAFG